MSSCPEAGDSASSSCDADLTRACLEAQRLIRGVLSFAEAELHRWDPARTAEVRDMMRKLAAAEAELRSMPADLTEEQANQRAIKQVEIVDLTASLKLRRGFPGCFRIIDDARAAAAGPVDCRAVARLGEMCSLLVELEFNQRPLPAAQQEVCRGWLFRADALFTWLCSVVPRLQLSREQSQQLLAAVQGRRSSADSRVDASRLRFSFAHHLRRSFPHSLVPASDEHPVCRDPYLRLFEFGLDPTLIEKGGNPLSALQLARNYVRDHPLPAVPPVDPLSELKAAIAVDSELEPNAIPSVLATYAMHHHEKLGAAEDQRREALHARFMHALIPAWLDHSTQVLALLLDAAPTRLIPPLVDIVARYLDLEGTLPEPAAAVAIGGSAL